MDLPCKHRRTWGNIQVICAASLRSSTGGTMLPVLLLLESGAGVESAEDRYQDVIRTCRYCRVRELQRKPSPKIHMLSYLKTQGAVFRSAQSHTCAWSHHFSSSGAPSGSLMGDVPASKFTDSPAAELHLPVGCIRSLWCGHCQKQSPFHAPPWPA